MPPKSISVLVADGQRLAAESLIVSLASCERIRPLSEPSLTADDAADAALRLGPDVVMMDHWIPGDLDALGATRLMSAMEKAPRVLVLSTLIGEAQVEAALAAGASGFLPRSLSLGEVAECVRRAHAGESPVFAKELRKAVEEASARNDEWRQHQDRLMTLSPREIKILRSLALGRSVDEIAAKLYLSPGTIRNHIQSILKKVEVRTQREAIKLARRARIVPPAYAREMGEHPGATPALEDDDG